MLEQLSLHTIETINLSDDKQIIISVRNNYSFIYFICINGFTVDMLNNRIIGTFKLKDE